MPRIRAWITALRHRLPTPVAEFLERLRWFRMPWVRDPDTHPRVPPATHVLIAPANFAGQGWQWARALERSGVPAVAWQRSAAIGFGYPADHRDDMTAQRASASWQSHVFAELVDTVEAVVIEAGRPVFGRLHGFDPVREVRALQTAGVRVATMWHGTDIRLPSADRSRHEDSLFDDVGVEGWTAALEAVAVRNHRRLAEIDAPVLVSTPDLLRDVPGARWCPVVIDPAAWSSDRGVLERQVPVVVHIPSNPLVKGTALIARAMADLDRAGLVEYRTARGVSAEQMREMISSADIVLDQFRLGIYGVAACEAMAAGRLVVSMVDQEVRDQVRASTGQDLPIVQATANTLGGVLDGVLADRDTFIEVAGAGPGFVAGIHDGRRSAAVLRSALGL